MHDCNWIRNQIYINSPWEVQGDVEHIEKAPPLIQRGSGRIKMQRLLDWNEPTGHRCQSFTDKSSTICSETSVKNISTYSHTTQSSPGSSTLKSRIFICEESPFCITQLFRIRMSYLQLLSLRIAVMFYLSLTKCHKTQPKKGGKIVFPHLPPPKIMFEDNNRHIKQSSLHT